MKSRRDMLYYMTASMGAVVVGAAVWPLVNQMNPSADIQAKYSPIRVDTQGIRAGEQLIVDVAQQPVFIKRRTAGEIAQARSLTSEQIANLRDPDAHNPALGVAPALDENRSLTPDGEWLVLIAICTKYDCVPLEGAGDFGGWICPCCGSHYDTSGRIRKGPAPRNLKVAPASFTSPHEIHFMRWHFG